MALVIENGTVVANANSYVTAAELVTYADLRGRTYPATQAEQEQLLIKAMDYLYAKNYKGIKTDPDNQLLDWPRSNAYVNGRYIDSDEMPTELKNAQIEAALLFNTIDLLQTGEVQNVASEQVDVLAVTYHSGGSWTTVRTDTVDVYLDTLLQSGGSFTTLRV